MGCPKLNKDVVRCICSVCGHVGFCNPGTPHKYCKGKVQDLQLEQGILKRNRLLGTWNLFL